MKCLDQGHTYLLDCVGKGRAAVTLMPRNVFQLHFYEMQEDGTEIDGVTNEEVLRVLIHRLRFLNNEWQGGKFRCIQNTKAIAYLEEALKVLEDRTNDRENRGVEGTHNL